MNDNLEFIKNNVYEDDPRRGLTGIICKIIEVGQYKGFGQVLKVLPLGLDNTENLTAEPKSYNVISATYPGLLGFPTHIRDTCYAFVLTVNPALIEGGIAFLIPKSFLIRNNEKNDKAQPDMISKKDLEELQVGKEQNMPNAKLS
jgi:hypothetical protein